jgi:hypothetical protein
LKDNPNVTSQIHNVRFSREDFGIAQKNRPRGASRGDDVIHPVDPAKKRTLSATAGTNECGHMVAGNPNVDLMQRLEVAVVGVEVRDRDR